VQESQADAVAGSASSQLLLKTLLQMGAAAAGTLLGVPAAAAGAQDAGIGISSSSDSSAVVSSSSEFQQNALAVARQLLCPDAAAAASWSPSWQCEAAAHALLATAVGSSAPHADAAVDTVDAAAGGSSDGSRASAAALTLQDSWKLSQASTVLEQFSKACSEQGACRLPDHTAATVGLGPQLRDTAVFEFLHAMAQVQSVLQVRPADVANFIRQHRRGGTIGGHALGLAAWASTGLGPSVFALKQLSSSIVLPADVLAPLAKTCVQLWMADAAAGLQQADSQQQQRQQELEVALQEAASMAVQGVAGLLFSSDPQLRMHAAAAYKQACCSSSSSGNDTGSSSQQGLHCAVFVGVTKLLLLQQQPCSQLLPAYQAVAEVASHILTSAAAEGDTQGSSSGLQPVAAIVKLLVQQATAQQQQEQQQQIGSGAGSPHMLQPDTADRTLLQLLLLSHIVTHAWQLQQQQQQQQQQRDADSSSSKKPSQQQQAATHSSAAEAAAAASKHRHPALCKQLLPQQLLGPLSASLLHTLQALVPLLQQQDCRGVPTGTQQQYQGAYTVAAGDGAQQAGPGGFPNYQALLSPPAGVAVWGLSSSCCRALWGMQGGSNSGAASSSGSSSTADWLLDPYHQGDPQGTRLLQGLPLQLTAAVLDLCHTLLRYGLLQAVGRLPASQLISSSSLTNSSSNSSQGPTGACAWAGVLCHVMDVKALLPIRRLAKQLLVDLAGSSAHYKEVRSVHLLTKHTSTLLHVLLPTQLQKQQQEREGAGQGALGASGVLGVVRAGVAALQGSWKQQCAAVAALAHILSVADSQPVAWAQVCSSSSSSSSSSGVSSSGCDVSAASAGPAVPNEAPVLLPLLLQLAMDCSPPQLCVTAAKLFNAALSGLVKSSSSSSSSSASKSSDKSKPGSKPAAAPTAAGQLQAKSGSGRELDAAAAGSSSGRVKEAAVSKMQLDLSWLLQPQQQQQQQQGGSSAGTFLLSAFIDRCVVGWPEAKERKEAAKTLVLLHRALGVMGSTAGQAVLLRAVLQAVPAAGPAAGSGSLQLFNAANQLLKFTGLVGGPVSVPTADAGQPPELQQQQQQPQSGGVDSQQQQQQLQLLQAVGSTAGELFTTAAAAAAALAAHPCGLAYQQLQELLEFQSPSSSSSSSSGAGTVGHWLELSGCDVANGRLERKPPSSAVRLDSIAAELKYGDKQVGHVCDTCRRARFGGGVVALHQLVGLCMTCMYVVLCGFPKRVRLFYDATQRPIDSSLSRCHCWTTCIASNIVLTAVCVCVLGVPPPRRSWPACRAGTMCTSCCWCCTAHARAGPWPPCASGTATNLSPTYSSSSSRACQHWHTHPQTQQQQQQQQQQAHPLAAAAAAGVRSPCGSLLRVTSP
jgi:hypothetical protein